MEEWNNGRSEESEKQPSILPPFVMRYLSEVHTRLAQLSTARSGEGLSGDYPRPAFLPQDRKSTTEARTTLTDLLSLTLSISPMSHQR